MKVLTFAATLIGWAKDQGCEIAESVEVRKTSGSGNGIYAARDIAKGSTLVRVPGHLQLGVETLADGDDVELQEMVRALPWRDVLDGGLTFLPCTLALCAEVRAGERSKFAPYLRELPAEYSNAVAPGWGDESDDPTLASFAPKTAAKVRARRTGLGEVHGGIAPSTLPFADLCWAAAAVCSRALVRSAAPEVSDLLVGPIAATDRTRLVPVIDLVNHGGAAANAAVRTPGDDADDVFATKLVLTRDVMEGEEIRMFEECGGGR